MEKIKISYENLAKIVAEEFIHGSSDEYLTEVRKAAKGYILLGIIFNKSFASKSNKYILHVSGPYWFMFKTHRRVWIENTETNQAYKLDKTKNWKKFYKLILSNINMEKINRNR